MRRHNQANVIDFINYVVNKFPFRIKTIRMDNWHEFQSKFNWHIHDLGVKISVKMTSSDVHGLDARNVKEKLFKTLVDRLLLAGTSGEGLFLIDKEMGSNTVLSD